MTSATTVDVCICGGGLAGLTMARQLRREQPERSVLVVDRQARPLPEATHKVGESSVELASRYFEHTLGLGDYLRERHLIKNGLRFFPGGGALPLADRTEIGPPQLPIVPSYQLDRGRLENDLRAMCEQDGVALIEGVAVEAVTLGEGEQAHQVQLADGRSVEARWLIDASGRRRLLGRQLGTRESSGHLGHAAWFRVEGRLDPGHLVPEGDAEWHRRDDDGIRWLSTSHLMGEGYWCWIIPLSSGKTSLGVVAHGAVHGFETLNTQARLMDWLERHEPVLFEALADHEVADFRALKDYSYTSSQVFGPRWAMVGEAGLFVDPFYSPGSDFIALANGFTGELVRADFEGRADPEYTEFLDWFYRRLALISTATYSDAAEVYGQPRVMAAKIYWDNFNYWSFVCPYFFQELYRLGLEEQKALVPLAQRWAELNLRGQRLFAAWAKRASDAPERRHVVFPPIPSILANLHLSLEEPRTREETTQQMTERAELAEELLLELLLRALSELSEADGASLIAELEPHTWQLGALPARLDAEDGEPRKRRKRISRLVRDLERTIGKISPHAELASLRKRVDTLALERS